MGAERCCCCCTYSTVLRTHSVQIHPSEIVASAFNSTSTDTTAPGGIDYINEMAL